MSWLRRLRRLKLDGNERVLAIAAIGLITLVASLTFRPTHADLIPLGAPPSVMTPAAAPEPSGPSEPRNELENGLRNSETGPWLHLGANVNDPSSVTSLAAGHEKPEWSWIGSACPANDPYRVKFCFESNPLSGGTPEREILTVGNSHSVQFTSALMEVADRRPNWSVRAMASPGCPFSYVSRPSNDCEQVWKVATDYILDKQPDLVVVLATRSNATGPENLLPGLPEWIRMIETSTKSQVVAIRDTPRFQTDMHECGLDKGTDAKACDQSITYDPIPMHRAAIEAAGATYIDLTQSFCPKNRCQPVLGGLWVYLDANHPNADYWRTLADVVSLRINADPNLRWWPRFAYLGQVIPRPNEPVQPVL